jgi:hypothetical protein
MIMGGPPAWGLDLGLNLSLLNISLVQNNLLMGGWRRLHKEKLHVFYSMPSIIRM